MTEKTKRRRLRFGLRSLLIATTLTALLLGLWVGPSMRQQQAVKFYEQLGLECGFAKAAWWVPQSWQQDYTDYFCRLNTVADTPVTDAIANKLFKIKIPPDFSDDAILKFLPNLRSVELANMQWTEFLPKLKSLEVLLIKNVNGDTLPNLPKVRTLLMYAPGKIDCVVARFCPNVKSLMLCGDVKNFEAITDLHQLEKLLVGSYGPRPATLDLEPLRKMPNLKHLRLNVKDTPSLLLLADCRALKELEMASPASGPLSLEPLLNLPALERVWLSNDRIDHGLTDEEMESKGFEIGFR